MKIKTINLRNVSYQEVPESYAGILRISPYNDPSVNVVYDDVSSYLKTENNKITLSDSNGNYLPINFVTKIYKTTELIPSNDYDSLAHIIHDYKNLHIIKSLNIRPTLFIDNTKNELVSPLTFKDENGKIIHYPIEAPYDDKYVNNLNSQTDGNTGRMPINPTNDEYTIDKFFDSFVYTKVGEGVYTDDNIVKVKESIVWDENNKPVLNRREYILGQCPYHSNSDTTKLSFIPLTEIIHGQVESNVAGITRHTDGRYENLDALEFIDPTFSNTAEDGTAAVNKLFDTLFGSIADNKNIVDENAHIVGLGVQSGTIHYSAIPPKNYFFQIFRRYSESNRKKYAYNDDKKTYDNVINKFTDAKTDSTSTMSVLAKEYALCDGKILKGENNITEYPHININSASYADTEKEEGKENTFGKLYSSLANSMNASSNTTIRTPALFNTSQYGLRFLRGLDWTRNNNNLTSGTYSQAALHYANYNYNSSKDNHYHYAFSNEDVTGENKLNDIDSVFLGLSNNQYPGDSSSTWTTYVNNNTKNFHNSYMMRSVQGTTIADTDTVTIRRIQRIPINNEGRTNLSFHPVASCCKYGKRRMRVCMNHRVRCVHYTVNDTGYVFKGSTTAPNMFPTSIQYDTKYGKRSLENEALSTLGTYSEVLYRNSPNSTSNHKIDDTLPVPNSINLLPLMKI
jgi:hypothetical protein